MDTTNKYDYIIAGGGCAGLSLVMHMIDSSKFSDKRILIVDKDVKNSNDRTWCFWETEGGLFEPVVKREWNNIIFHCNHFSKTFDISPYKYKLIRGIDFYNFCLQEIKQHPNIEWGQGNVEKIYNTADGASIIIDGIEVKANYIFSSILFSKPQLKKNEYWLLQHFKGYVIKAPGSFDPASATLMDFRTDQTNGTTFFYVMPFSKDEALIEYTLFSPQVLTEAEYDKALKGYITNQLSITDFSIQEEEFGIIPMSNHRFPAMDGSIMYIGTAGGQTKASSGYTFRFIQKQSAQIVNSIVATDKPSMKSTSKRFSFYDSVLLNILEHNKLGGDKIFSELFGKNKIQDVLKFLDNESSVAEEIRILSSLPTKTFAKAALHHLRLSY